MTGLICLIRLTSAGSKLTLSLCVSQARLAIQRGAQAVIFDITDDPGAAAAVVCVCVS